MTICSPQRYLANNRNALRTAELTPSSVMAVDNSVLAIPYARAGTAQVLLTGSYTGAEEATYDVEVVDDTISTNLISAPVAAAVGSGQLLNVVASGTAQNYVVELADAGTPERYAFVDFEGVQIVARTIGAGGNTIRLEIDQSGLVFTPSTFSLLDDLKAGAGSETTGLEGAAYDWDTAVIGSDNQIPASAHRIAFGDDTSVIYLAYKRFADTKWTYHFVPEIKRDVAKGTIVNFVTDGREVTVTDGITPEVYPDIITVYDLLEALKTGSVLLDIAGVVANDRSPTGQAARELTLRTDAHVEPSYGSGGSADGFINAFANVDAGTELVTATCFAITGKDNPNARLGREMWRVRGSLSGELNSTAFTGIPYNGPQWGFTIPRKLPDNYGSPKGRISAQVSYVARDDDADPPPVCVAGMVLGPDASDGSYTFRYTARPTGDCLCSSMPFPNLRTACLGLFDEGGPAMGYTAATIARVVDMYDWQADVVRAHTAYGAAVNEEDPFIAAGLPPYSIDGTGDSTAAVQEGLLALCSNFESVIAEIQALDESGTPTALQTAGYSAWDTALAELKADVGGAAGSQTLSASAYENLTAGQAVSTFIDNAGAVRVRKAISGGLKLGFVTANVTAPASATVYFWGVIAGASPGGFTPGTSYTPSGVTPGNWIVGGALTDSTGHTLVGVATSTTELQVTQGAVATSTAVYLGLLADRYETRLLWVGSSAGIPQVGKTNADSIVSGDGCWRDWSDGFYWEAVGSDYAPAFNNHAYYSSRLASDGKRYFSTHEFAFQVNVKCPEDLLEGDSFTVFIGDAGSSTTYQIGDVLTLPVIAAQPFYLAGGQDGDDQQRWFVSGSVDGPFAPFTYSLAAALPHSYSSGGLAFDIEPGGIPFEKGDRFTFGVEGAHYRWRKNGGTWSSPVVVPLAPALLDSGLSIEFVTGAAPSFVADDMFKFRALQPWAVSNIQYPTPGRWQWTGASPTMVADFGEELSLDMAAIALHTLPAGATITIEGGTSPGVYTWLETLTRQPGVIFGAFAATQIARYVRLTLTGATDAGIGWWWIGEGLSTELGASIQLRRAYKVIRGSAGLRNVGKFVGKSISGDIEWTEGALTEADIVEIAAFVDWVKENDDEPFVLVPQVTRPTEALIAQIISDDVDIIDVSDYNRDAAFERRFSAKLPLAGVW